MTSPAAFDLTYLGHAGFVVDGPGLSVLIDPFFYPAFVESWFPYPDNRGLLDELRERRFTHAYFSHAHDDHFDRRFIADLPRDLTIICPEYRSKTMVRELRAMGFTDLLVLGHQQSADLAPVVRATMILDTSHKEDSALFLELDGFRFLHLNDCHPAMNELPRQVDLLAAQYSGAMWYPNCYEYDGATMARKVGEVRFNLLDTLVRTSLACEATAYLPSAGPACFLDPSLERFNDPVATIFPRWPDVAGEFTRQRPDVTVVDPGPGDVVRLQRGAPLNVKRRPAATPVDLATYRAARADEWGAFGARDALPVTTDEITRYFVSLTRKNRELTAEFSKTIVVASAGQSWTVSWPGDGSVTVVEGDNRGSGPIEYRFELDTRVLRGIVNRDFAWEEALLSMRVRLRREPDRFDPVLLGLLRYGNQPVQTQQMVLDMKGSDETIERDGWCLQRFCPHAGEDLTHAHIEGDVVECPRHHWKWDARTGECIAGGSLRLRIAPLEPSLSS